VKARDSKGGSVHVRGPVLAALDRLAKQGGVDRATMLERLVTGNGTLDDDDSPPT
jgi:hypothetical protein